MATATKKATTKKAAEAAESTEATDTDVTDTPVVDTEVTTEATGVTRAATDTIDVRLFDKFRERAIKSPKSASGALVTNEPFILGPDDGFERTIEIERPNFTERLNIGIYLQEQDIVGLLQSVFGTHTAYILHQLNRYEAATGEIADEIFLGIVMAYLEHFYGKDAASQVFKKLSV